MAKRVRYGLKNLYYSSITENADGTLTYATPIAIPGAKSITMKPKTSKTEDYADDGLWYVDSMTYGYDGSFEVEDTLAFQNFCNEVFSRSATKGSSYLETPAQRHKPFCLLGEFGLAGSTETGRRFCLYYVIADTPEESGSTNSPDKTIATYTVNFTAIPDPAGRHLKYSENSSGSLYDTFFVAVPLKTQPHATAAKEGTWDDEEETAGSN